MFTYHGWLIIDKPLGLSSAQVVGKVKHLLGKETKIGHTGTLDPLATGVLPLALGEATKLAQFMLATDKEYEFEITWGEERSTDDAQGEIVQRSEIRRQKLEIVEAIKSFIGEIEQVPPIYSAIKIEGRRSYNLARAAHPVELKPKKVTVYSLELLAHSSDRSSLKIKCSKGTYIRALARDLGRKLGSFGYVSSLRRTRHGKFGLNSAISLEKLAEACEKGSVSAGILPVEEVLDGIPAFPLDEVQEAKIRHGVPLDNVVNLNASIIALMKNGKLVAIASPEASKLQPKRVFNH